jgi:hypothetical protein
MFAASMFVVTSAIHAQSPEMLAKLNAPWALVTENGKSATRLFTAYLDLTKSPVEVGEEFNQTTIYPGMTGFAEVAKWADVIMLLAPDTAQTTTLHIGISLGSGAFTTYNAALPFGAGSRWSGYWRMSAGVSAGVTPTDWRYYETAETVKFVCSVQNTNHRVAHAGAIIDPETPDAVDAETDGRVYGMYVTGSNNSLSSTMLSSNAAAGNYYAHGSLAGYTHSGMFSPGTSTFLTLTRANFLNTSLAHVLPTSTGRSPRWPILLNRGATNFAGRLREVAWTPDSTLGSGLVAGLSTVGYRISSSTSVANETVLLVK